MKKLKRLFANKCAIKSLRSKKMFGFAAVSAGFAAFGAQAHAQIIEDNFTSGSAYGTAIGKETADSVLGLAPVPINEPGGVWQHITGAWYDGSEVTGNTNPTDGHYDLTAATFHNSAASGMSLGSYNTGSLTISVGVYFNNGNGAVGSNGAIYLGFSSQLNSASNYGPSPTTYFTGLDVTHNFSLQQFVNGIAVGTPIAYGGTYSAYEPNGTPGTELSYTINTATGAISNVSFGGSTASYNFTTPGTWSSAYTANTEIGGTGDNGSNTAVFTSFELSEFTSPSVPEPSTYALLISGALALGAYHHRRRRAGF